MRKDCEVPHPYNYSDGEGKLRNSIIVFVLRKTSSGRRGLIGRKNCLELETN